MSKTVLLTGGAGFIGSALVRYLINDTDTQVVNVDKLTYAGSLLSLGGADNSEQHHFHQCDICDAKAIRELLTTYQPDFIMHLAAESHVDRSIDGPGAFIQTNIVGTYTLLEAAREYYASLSGDKQQAFKFHHISTDEVYGSLGETGLFTETTRYKPNSPYSASKAKAISGGDLPIYGKGDNVRDWLFVDDHVKALWKIVTEGENGEVYNVGGHNEKTNLEVVDTICAILDDLKPRSDGNSYQAQKTFVKDRPGHDKRYAIDASKIAAELNWTPEETFESGIRKTIEWYLAHDEWVKKVSGDYDGNRLGH